MLRDNQRALSPRPTRPGDCLATALDATPEDFIEAEKLLDTVERRYRRIFGESHPFTTQCQDRLRRARVMARMAEQFG